MCCFFIHFPTVVPDMEKAGLKSHFSSDLPVPLIAERIDLIRKLSKIFIRHALKTMTVWKVLLIRRSQILWQTVLYQICYFSVDLVFLP